MNLLSMNSCGRWQIGEDDELTCGSVLEIRVGGMWVSGRIEAIGFPARYVFLASHEEGMVEIKRGMIGRRPDRKFAYDIFFLCK